MPRKDNAACMLPANRNAPRNRGFAQRGVPKRVIGEAALRDALAGMGAGRHRVDFLDVQEAHALAREVVSHRA